MVNTYLYVDRVPTKKLSKTGYFVNFNEFLEHFSE